MRYPNFNEEKKLWKKGYEIVVGLDEVGRGCLSGPVVAAAFTVSKFLIFNFKFLNIKDSKQLTAKKREEIYKNLTNNPDVGWGIGVVSEKIIDKINILEATKLAMRKAVASLEKKSRVDYLLIDGNFGINIDIPQKSIIKGDQKVFSIAAASIIAKVYRDRLMKKYHKKYPQYGFDIHKGYPTKSHCKALEKYGACKIHRKTFYPVKKHY